MRRHVVGAAALIAAGALACGSDSDPPPDAPPAIERVLVAPEVAEPGALVQLTAVANDPEGGALSFAWELPAGWTVEGSPFAATVAVRAPARVGEAALASVVATDAGGRVARDAALLRTAPAADAPAVTFRALLAAPNPVAPGGTLAIAPVAESADGAAVEYAYQVSEPDWSVEPAVAGARVVAPFVFERSATLTVSAQGAAGGRAVARLLVSTERRSAPSLDALVATPAVAAPGGTVALRAVASSPHGLPLEFAWSILGDGWTLEERGETAVATAPPRGGTSATVAVVVSDVAGGTTSGVAALASAHAPEPAASIVVSPAVVAPGGAARLVASAPAGALAPLAWEWSVDDPAWTLSARGEVASLTAPLAYGRAAVVDLRVTDGAGAAGTAHAIVSTAPHAAPAISSLVAAPAAAAPGEAVQVSVVAASAAGLPLEYRWTVAGEGWTIEGDGPGAVVRAPAFPGRSAIVAVEATDAAGASARATIAVATTQ